MRLLASRLLLVACAVLAVVPATAGAATTPKVTSVAPLKLKIGQKLTIKGSGFVPGKNRNTVVFKARGQRAVFVKAATATKTRLVVKVPAKLAAFLTVKSGQAVATRFQLRVLAKKLSKAYTAVKASPTIAPAAAATSAPAPATKPTAAAAAAAPAPAAAPTLTPYEQCQAAAAANAAGDQDADGMKNGDERTFHMNPCEKDGDGDGMLDGYEYEAARDLASHSSGVTGRPFPALRPWPNPMDASDRNHDFDGDGLTLAEEYDLWWARGHHFPIIEYSDGFQATGGPLSAVGQEQLDLNANGFLSDERDADLDGLSNEVELHLRGLESWWGDVEKENRYTPRPFGVVDPTRWDSDGDGVSDGAGDQDVDGFSNITEMQLVRGPTDTVHTTKYIVDPFNPCMPNPHADTCSRYVPFGITDVWRPLAGDEPDAQLGDALPLLNGPEPGGWTGDTWDGHPGPPDA